MTVSSTLKEGATQNVSTCLLKESLKSLVLL
jgi:hypothetical protein